jgi:3',5'-cyclic AMP phosphodiesterase CpdA
VFVLAHLSDPHVTPPRPRPGELPSLGVKRWLGALAWRVDRSREHRPEIARALARDLAEQRADHVAVTGDLTNLSLESEFAPAAEYLRSLGPPDRVTVVPGNHDAYAPIEPARSWARWADYLHSDREAGAPAPAAAPSRATFPTVRRRGRVALVGLCSAEPRPAFDASGSLGADQLTQLDAILGKLGDEGRVRIVLIHHSPQGAERLPQRRLRDSAELRAVLMRRGAELVLHGHGHRSSFASLPGPAGSIPVVGVRSASAAGRRPERRAQYHLLRIPPPGDAARIAVEIRGLDAASGRFVAQGECAL